MDKFTYIFTLLKAAEEMGPSLTDFYFHAFSTCGDSHPIRFEFLGLMEYVYDRDDNSRDIPKIKKYVEL